MRSPQLYRLCKVLYPGLVLALLFGAWSSASHVSLRYAYPPIDLAAAAARGGAQ